MFSFESMLGYLLPAVHGTTGLADQYIKSKKMKTHIQLILFSIAFFCYLGMTNRFFLFNQFSKKKISDSYVFQWISSQFSLNQISGNKTNLLEPKQRLMSEIESSFNLHLNFDIDFNSYTNPIFSSRRIKLGGRIFHCKDYDRVGPKKCNFIISFKQNNSIQYGIIDYFLKVSSEIFVALNELKVVGNLYENIGARTSVEITNLRNNGAFNRFFCYCQKTDKFSIIHSRFIITKCIVFKQDALNYCISEYIDLPEHS